MFEKTGSSCECVTSFLKAEDSLETAGLYVLPSFSPMNTFTKLLDTLKTMNGLLNGMIVAKSGISINLGNFCFSLYRFLCLPGDIDIHGMRARSAFQKLLLLRLKKHITGFTFFTNFKFSGYC